MVEENWRGLAEDYLTERNMGPREREAYLRGVTSGAVMQRSVAAPPSAGHAVRVWSIIVAGIMSIGLVAFTQHAGARAAYAQRTDTLRGSIREMRQAPTVEQQENGASATTRHVVDAIRALQERAQRGNANAAGGLGRIQRALEGHDVSTVENLDHTEPAGGR